MGRIELWFLNDADFVLGRENFSVLDLVQTRLLPNYHQGVLKKKKKKKAYKALHPLPHPEERTLLTPFHQGCFRQSSN